MTTAVEGAATTVVRGPRLLPVPEAAAPAQQATQHTIPTTIPMGTMMVSTIPAMVTPTIRPTMLTAQGEE